MRNQLRYRLRRWGPVIAYLILACAMAYELTQIYDVAHRADQASIENRALAVRVATDAKARVNESCIQSETRYDNAVERLASTYRYLVALPADERQTTLNQFIIKSIPQTEQDAKDSKAPTFCDKPNTGLPEPNPIFPERPPIVVKLLGRAGDTAPGSTIPPSKI